LPTGYHAAGAGELRIELGLTRSSAAGDVWLDSGELISGADQVRVQGTSERIGHFPAGTGCGAAYQDISRSQLVRRVALVDALLGLNAMSPTRATGEVGTADADLSLEFRNADDSVCRETPTPVQSALVFPGLVTLDSGDGRIVGSLDVDVVVLAGISRVTASAGALSDDAELAAALPAQFGILDAVELSGYEASAVEARFGRSPDGTFGSLRAFGMSGSGCAGNAASADAGAPDVPAADADAGPDCNPGERTQVWGVRWGIAPSDL
jgi:hypothetical protein